ncbi:hypothetical protein AQUCO_04000093v1 [Aquilegia coerulea]|uniref:HTH three-helical bundle domain-containing protein n=1 Tax=Aquilegia coerulea TaxID=218851 RepID=A0A2G5CR54_AQUCA|nr:hypothetical protein AQUCO_04000093v1 [Aquilegia coerulea]
MVSKQPAKASNHVGNVETLVSENEQTAAKALLLLSSKPPRIKFLSPLTSSSSSSSSEDLSPTDSKCSSTVTSKVSSSGNNVRADLLRVLTSTAKVMKRSRSKHYYYRNSNRQENVTGIWRRKPAEVSYLPNASSAVIALRAPRQYLMSAAKPKCVLPSPYLKRQADVILKVLSVGCASEIEIRQVFGDTPTTSKALRMLLKLEKVVRVGAGGRKDPYIYMVISSLQFLMLLASFLNGLI